MGCTVISRERRIHVEIRIGLPNYFRRRETNGKTVGMLRLDSSHLNNKFNTQSSRATAGM